MPVYNNQSMSLENFRRSVAGAQMLTQLAQEHGVSIAACLRDTRLDAAALADPQTEITAAQELQLIRNLVRELGHIPGIGLDAGMRYHISVAGMWGFAVASSLTYRRAAKLLGKFHDLTFAFVRFRLKRKDERYMVLMDDTEIPADLKTFLIERDFAGFITMGKDMRPGGLPLRGVDFRGPRPPYANRFRALCGVEPRFGAATNALWVDAEALDIPLTQGDSILARMLEEQCRHLLARRQMRGGIAGKVRDVLLRSPDEIPGVDYVASRLLMAPRSLRRRLEQEGTSFREVVTEVRQALAEEMLTGTRIKLEEIAIRLGYSDPSSFIAAFKRWRGVSPDSFRRQYNQQKVIG